MLTVIKVGSLVVPSYGVCMALGIIVACITAYIRMKSSGGTIDSVLMVAAVSMVMALTGAKLLYYIASYGLGRLFHEIISGDFSSFENTGLVFYGGLIGGVVGAIIAIRANRYDFHSFANAAVPCIPLGHSFGRVGCLLAGCCYGKHYNGLFAVHSVFVEPSELLFPIQAVEALLNIVLFLVLIWHTKRRQDGVITLVLYVLLYSTMRFILEFFRGDAVRGLRMGLSTSQWISCLLAILSIIIWCFRSFNIIDFKVAQTGEGDNGR